MARDYKGTSEKAEKQGSGIGGGPVGSSGGYSGRPGGDGPAGDDHRPRASSVSHGPKTPGSQGPRPSGPRPGARPKDPSERASNGTPDRGAGSGLLLAGLISLLLGRKGNGQNGGGSGGILRIVLIAVIAIVLLRSCSGTGLDLGLGTGSYNSNNGGTTVIATAAPTLPPTPRPTVAPTPKPTVAPTPKPTPSLTSSSSYSGSFADNSYFFNGNSFGGSSSGSTGLDLASLFGGYSNVNSGAYTSSGWSGGNNNNGSLNTGTVDGQRAKFTTIRGNGKDTVTIMVFLCGTDLESNYSMATKDLQEMANAPIADNVNIIVYTGGCSKWNNNLISSRTNQIYKIENGGQFRLLNSDVGNKPMVTPATLSEFIQFCAKYYPADRNMLIFWDHGGGSLAGYGYDQKFKSSGSMTLDGIDEALSVGGVKFDVIGFDACLMATVETAQMASKYADYMIASEESEPGIGWYYTDWVTLLSRNTSTPTLTVGKQIVDDFVKHCARSCAGQDTTLSLVDLAEFAYTVPPLLNNWADSTAAMVKTDYRSVSRARGNAKEFAASSRIDQADLVSICYNLNDSASKALADALLSSVKYNKTSSTVRNAYGLSIYFPYRSVSSVKKAASTYSKIGMDDNYSRCIQAYATVAASGQASSYSNGYSSGLGSLLTGGSGYGSSSYTTSYDTADLIYALLGQMMSGRSLGNLTGVSEDDVSFIADTFNSGALDARSVADYISENTFDASLLNWTEGADGVPEMALPQSQWDLVSELKLSVFRDDGKGFIDLGLDLYPGFFKENGALSGEYDGGWLAVNGREVAYYQLLTMASGDGSTVTLGRVPCLYNGERANLLIEIVNDVPAVVGVCYDYQNDADILTNAKTVTEYNSTDTVCFIADYYTYDNVYENTYRIGEEFTVGDGLQADFMLVSDVNEISACYRLTDFYGNAFWTPVMRNAETA